MIALMALVIQATASPTAAAPVGKWGVDYSPTQCLITRSFIDGGENVTLAIDAGPTTGEGDIVLISSRIVPKARPAPARITVLPGGAALRISWFGAHGPKGTSIARLQIAPATWATIATAKRLSIDGMSATPITVPVEGIDKAAEAAKTCGNALLRAWGADPDAMIDPSQDDRKTGWVSFTDYPVDALRNNQQGTVTTITTIDAKGKPSACRTVVSSGVPSLDAATCHAIVARAHYDPSDKTARYLYGKTVWLIP